MLLLLIAKALAQKDVPATCPKIEAFVHAEPEPSIWRFLTQPEARDALDPKSKRNADAVAALPRWLAIITGDSKKWPEAAGRKSGSFSGNVTFVELASGNAVCKRPFSFANSKPVRFINAHDVEDTLTEDLEDNFKVAMKALRVEVLGDAR